MRVDVPTPRGGWGHPWPAVFELLRKLPPRRCVLIGGLMVQLHGIIGGSSTVRPTDDLDILVDVLAPEPGALLAVVEQLLKLGYRHHPPGFPDAPAHRFVRPGPDHEWPERAQMIVDVLVADHLPPPKHPHLQQRPTMAAPGGRQALDRTMVARVQAEEGEDAPVDIALPDLLGALVLKGAAYKVDNRDPGRHLLDAALLSSMIDAATERSRVSKSDRRHLSNLVKEDALGDDFAEAWVQLGEGPSRRGKASLHLLLS